VHYGRCDMLACELVLRCAQMIQNKKILKHETSIACSRLEDNRSSTQTHAYFPPSNVRWLSGKPPILRLMAHPDLPTPATTSRSR
jgi:hypothetical protein